MVLTAKGIIIFTYTPTVPQYHHQPFGLVLISLDSIRLRVKSIKNEEEDMKRYVPPSKITRMMPFSLLNGALKKQFFWLHPEN